MPWDKDAVYYYADGDNAIGPFTLAKLRQMVAAGLISGDVYVGVAESDDWKPLCELINIPGKTRARSSPVLGGVAPTEAATTVPFWAVNVSRWPNAFIIAAAILVLAFWLYAWSGNNLFPGAFDWHLYLANAGVEVGILAILLVGIKALKDARKRFPLKSAFPKFCASLLLVLLFLTALPSGLFVVNLYSAYNAYTTKEAFTEVAPEQFRLSITENRPVPVLGEDALVIRDMQYWFSEPRPTSEGYLREQLKRNISPPLSELLVTFIAYERYYQSAELEQEMRRQCHALAQMYGFQSWEELQYFVATQGVPAPAL
jgi:hypothetical protein